MSLTLAYEIARGGLMANSTATSVVSRNISNVDNPNAARKSVATIGTGMGGVRLGTIGNAIATSLLESVLANTSKQGELGSIAAALDRLGSSINDPELGLSPSAMLSEMQSALYAAAAEPGNEVLQRKVLSAAQDVVSTINSSATLVSQVRNEANSEIADSVNQLGTMLDEFERVNSAIVSGTTFGRDVTDDIDRRNSLLRDLSGMIDIQATTRSNNDMVLFAANGTTLFETVPRAISFENTPLSPGQPGGRLTIDGVPFSGTAAGQLGGKLGGLLQIRDDVALTFGRQIDEIARGLIVAFSESDQSAVPVAPDIAGLFTYAGGPGLPPDGLVADGLAMSIRVNPNADPAQGGSLARIRDGGIGAPGDPAYVYNAGGTSGFSDRLRDLAAMMSQAQSFDPGAGLAGSTSLLGLASTSAGWIEGQRSTAQAQLEDREVLGERALSAWQGRIGVNLDEEMTTLMSLERSYQASSRLISTVNQMFDSLFRATE
jgi:flagellar hook-associated protein 1 FlgK